MKAPNIDIGFNVTTLAVGVVAYLFGPALLSAAGGLLRGVAKTGIKGGIIAYDRGKQITEEARTSLKEWSTEVQVEIKEARPQAKAAAKAASK